MAIAPNGDVFASDGDTGELFVLPHDAAALQTLVPPGELVSPQQPAVAPDGRTVLVAGYVRGIAAVDPATGWVTWLPHARVVALNGIDGLVFHGPDLIAMQNGTEPNRILRLTVDSEMRARHRRDGAGAGPGHRPAHARRSRRRRGGRHRQKRVGPHRAWRLRPHRRAGTGATLVRIPLR
jgi:hypothetical protein